MIFEQAVIAKLKQDYEDLKQTNEALRADNKTLFEQATDFAKKLGKERDDNLKLRAEVDKLTKWAKACADDAGTADGIIKRLEAKVKRLKEDFRLKAKSYDANSKGWQADVRQLRAEVERLQMQLKRYEPVSHYNGLSIEDWKQKTDKAAADLAAAVEIITGCIGSLEYVDRNHKNVTGYGVREQRIAEANPFLARMEVKNDKT